MVQKSCHTMCELRSCFDSPTCRGGTQIAQCHLRNATQVDKTFKALCTTFGKFKKIVSFGQICNMIRYSIRFIKNSMLEKLRKLFNKGLGTRLIKKIIKFFRSFKLSLS